MNAEEIKKLKHMLDAAVEHCRLQHQEMTYDVVPFDNDVIVNIVLRMPMALVRDKISGYDFKSEIHIKVRGGTRNAVLEDMTARMQEMVTGLHLFLGLA
jgi:hypothetical protein